MQTSFPRKFVGCRLSIKLKRKRERDSTHTSEPLKTPEARSLFLLPAPGGTNITWLAEDWPGLALLSVFELSLIFWALSLMLFRLLLLLALLAIKLMMLNTEMRRAIILKALISPFPKNIKAKTLNIVSSSLIFRPYFKSKGYD